MGKESKRKGEGTIDENGVLSRERNEGEILEMASLGEGLADVFQRCCRDAMGLEKGARACGLSGSLCHPGLERAALEWNVKEGTWSLLCNFFMM